MLDSIYIGMSGLTSFSKGLSNISNNVANLNTAGFKGTELDFYDLFYRYQYGGTGSDSLPFYQGSGVKAGATYSNFSEGDFRQTGNDLDVAVDGNGFFIFDLQGKVAYGRSGQFSLDSEGNLTSREDGAKVYGISNGNLAPINISGKRSSPPTATSLITFTDTLSSSSASHSIPDIVIYDSLGAQHTFRLDLVNDSTNTPGRWTFQLFEGSVEVTAGEILYDTSGVPIAGFSDHTFGYVPTGAQSTVMRLDFSSSNYFSSSASSLKVQSQNGSAAGYLLRTSIDADGYLVLSYSNGKTDKAGQLALASFSNLNELNPLGGSRYSLSAKSVGKVFVGSAGQQSLGTFKTGGIELSNVDLAQQFSELIIVQRGYQASSQVISAANEMIQQLGEIRGRR